MSPDFILTCEYALSVAQSLMVCYVVFKTGDGQFSAIPYVDYDEDPSLILREIDPST